MGTMMNQRHYLQHIEIRLFCILTVSYLFGGNGAGKPVAGSDPVAMTAVAEIHKSLDIKIENI